jgi:hypothetical protein
MLKVEATDWRWITYPSGKTRLAGFWPPEVNKDAPAVCPMSPTSPAGTTPSPSRIVIPIDPCSPHIPVRNPPINKDTLKELDLEAILHNPQLRASHPAFLQFKKSFSAHQVTISFLILACSSVPLVRPVVEVAKQRLFVLSESVSSYLSS